MKSIASLAIALFLVTGCVSKKKFLQSQDTVSRLRSDSTQFTGQIDTLEHQLLRLQDEFVKFQASSSSERATLLAQLDQKSMQLTEKDKTLQARAEKLRQLQEQISKQREAVDKLRKTVAEALNAFSSDQLSVEMKDGKVKVSLSDQLLFESGSAKVNEQGKNALGKLAVVLKNNPDINIMVVGHTDSLAINTVRYKDNWDLSVDRAVVIARLLEQNHGISGKRLQAVGQSEFLPVGENKTKEGRAKNRRTEIYLTPKLDELYKLLLVAPTSP